MDFKINMYKHSKVFVLIVLLFSCTNIKMITENQRSSHPSTDSALSKQRQLLKEYAVCQCLEHKFQDDTSLQGDGSVVGLIEISQYSKDAFDAVDSFVLNKSANSYKSKEKNRL
jgi:hypothetical protein